MTVIILYDGLDFGMIGLHKLENGETVLERQIRVLESRGINTFLVTGVSPDQASGIKGNTKTTTKVRYIDSIPALKQALPAFADQTLFVEGRTVFSPRTIEHMLKSEAPCQTLISKNPALADNPLRAKVETRTLTAISESERGVGWFAHIPIYKLGSEAAGQLLDALRDDRPLADAARTLLSTWPIHYADCGTLPLFANVFTPETAREVQEQVVQSDFASREIISGDCSLLELDRIVAEKGSKRPFLVCDDRFSVSLVRDYLDQINLDCVAFEVSGTPDLTVVQNGAAAFSRNNCDLILSVGSGAVIDAAKAIKAFSASEQGEVDLSRPFAYSPTPHIAIPFDLQDGAESTPSASILLEDGRQRLLSHCSLMPDCAILYRHALTRGSGGGLENDANAGILPDGADETPRLKERILRILRRFPLAYSAARFVFRKSRFKYYHLKQGVNHRAVVFEPFHGNSYNCNPKALYEQMLSDEAYSSFIFVWALNNPEKYDYLKENPRTKVVERNSKAYIRACATSKHLISGGSFPFYIAANDKQALINTWHGKPFKRIGCDKVEETEHKRTKKQSRRVFTKNGGRLTYLFSPAPVFSAHMASAYNLAASNNTKAVIETGYPRNDFLFRHTAEDVLRVKIHLGIPLRKKVILYAPTWRPYNYMGARKYEYGNRLNFKRLYQQLGDGYVLLFRAHHFESGSVNFSDLSEFVYNVTGVEDINDLYIISDLLISDYSSAIFDFANLRRPMVFYLYDLERYTKSANGLYFPVDVLPGKIVHQEEEVAPAIRESLATFTYDEKYQLFNETYNCLDGPDCAGKTLRKIIDLEAPPDPLWEKRTKQRMRLKYVYYFLKVQVPGFFRGRGVCLSENSKKLASYKNKHKGQRCFLVGNGPSLTMADLETLRGEICFGCNLIYKVFDSVQWRPTYYFISDTIYPRTKSEEIKEHTPMPVFTNDSAYKRFQHLPRNIIRAKGISRDIYYVHGNMLAYYVPSQATVMSYMIETAMYMGFSEIYLIGIDMTNSFAKNSHFSGEYRDDEINKAALQKGERFAHAGKIQVISVEKMGDYFTNRASFAYEQIARYADANGFKIFNATRGGQLEVFERVDLGSITAVSTSANT